MRRDAYIKLLTQLFGDRLMIGNATGCTSIYGGNLPTTPYTHNAAGRGPTWSKMIRAYIKNQEMQDRELDQHSMIP